ncbi:MAG: hypothetical protein ACRD6W_03560, partial [Nitrososphaerales archaeon]
MIGSALASIKARQALSTAPFVFVLLSFFRPSLTFHFVPHDSRMKHIAKLAFILFLTLSLVFG